jgi:hypothetical protein
MTRFIKQDEVGELVNLWHLSRVPASGQAWSNYDRMQWTVKEFCKAHPEYNGTAVYKDLCAQLDR